jgi:hypothetical protein
VRVRTRRTIATLKNSGRPREEEVLDEEVVRERARQHDADEPEREGQQRAQRERIKRVIARGSGAVANIARA